MAQAMSERSFSYEKNRQMFNKTFRRENDDISRSTMERTIKNKNANAGGTHLTLITRKVNKK